jgi:hypothetical protein
MLHGWAQNVFVFSNRAKKLTKRLTKAGYRVVFLQAPHRLPPIIPTEQKQQQQQQQQRSCDGGNNTTTINNGNENEHIDSSCSFSREYAYAWFFYDNSNENSNSDEPIVLPSPTGNYRGMDRSLQFIHEEIQAVRNNHERKNNKNNDDDDDDDDDDDQNQGENDVPLPTPPVLVLGFSQGAVVVHKIATLTCSNDDDNDNDDDCWKDVRKCILVSGFSFTTSIGKPMKTKKMTTTVNNGSSRSNSGSSSDCNYEHNLDHGGDDDEDEDDDKKATNTTTINNIIPSLHVLGNNDHRVRPYLTRKVYLEEPCFGFGSGILWEHPRGHVLPQDRNFCNRVLEFLTD